MARERWISNNLHVFLMQGENRARELLADPERFEIPKETAEQFAESMKRFRAVLTSTGKDGQSRAAKDARKEARHQAVKILRRIGNLVRSNPSLDAATKLAIGIEERSKAAKTLSCPQEPPSLRFVRAVHASSTPCPMHELKFRAIDSSRSRPDGAVRLELFIDLIGMEEQVPVHPAQNHGGRPWYYRSYTKSPIVILPPMPRAPMIMLYWARWADTAGNVGPFCNTVRATMPVGGMGRFLTPQFKDEHKPMPLFKDTSDKRDVTIRVAVLEMQRSMMLPNAVVEDAKQLEGPEQELSEREAA